MNTPDLDRDTDPDPRPRLGFIKEGEIGASRLLSYSWYGDFFAQP